jgi:integrase
MILRIFYGCGTRLSETLALRRKDVDFKARTIFLRETKNSKERRIPIHETLVDILEKYCLTLGIMLNPEAYLFPGDKQGTHYTTRQTATWFSKFLRLANIDQREKKQGERGASIHCLRHVFVLKSMRQLEAAGHSVDINDLLLPTYLGHDCLLDTDKYMKFSGAQIPESLDAFEAFTAGLIPKVEVPYEDE